MVEKEINQLKRGRVLGKVREPKKIPIVGEVTDSASVLKDSIAKKHPQYTSGNHIPSQSLSIEKTTTVDMINEVSTPFETRSESHDCSIAKQKKDYRNPRNNSSGHRPTRSTQHEELDPIEEFSDNTHYSSDTHSKRKSGHPSRHDGSHNHDRTPHFQNHSHDCCGKETGHCKESYTQANSDYLSQNNRTDGRLSNAAKCFRKDYGDGETYDRQCPKESKCGIKCLWNKILTFLGLKTATSNKHIRMTDGHSRRRQLNQSKEVNRHSNGQGNRRNRNY
ncbi:MAG: hypothetical protein LBJ13_00055 [Puniceicoccales bacterium]|jgi:hypothetical protein|nr:hypothetical protein [Puniceicoccales bacterium]